jgi:hypothetical protein
MTRLDKYLTGRTFFHDSSGVHDGNPVGYRANDGEIVRDVDDRETEFASEPVNFIKNVLLGDNIETGGRFVQDCNQRLADQGHCDGDSLLLSTR